jgi:two-component system KDP operon response regulator KdpE
VLRRADTCPTAGAGLAKPGAAEPLFIDEDLTIDFPRRTVIVRGEQVKLRPTEYWLLQQLVENAGWIVPQEVLLSKAWGPEYRDDSQLLWLHITYLRKVIEPDPATPRCILTERGVGYRFTDYKRGM